MTDQVNEKKLDIIHKIRMISFIIDYTYTKRNDTVFHFAILLLHNLTMK